MNHCWAVHGLETNLEWQVLSFSLNIQEFKYRSFLGNAYIAKRSPAQSNFNSVCWAELASISTPKLNRNRKILKMAKKSNFHKKIQKNLFLQKCAVHHSINFQSFELQFFANILILLVLTDSTIKALCYMRSCGVTFANSVEIFKGPGGGELP